MSLNMQSELTEKVIHVDMWAVAPHRRVGEQLVQRCLTCFSVFYFVDHIEQLCFICDNSVNFCIAMYEINTPKCTQPTFLIRYVIKHSRVLKKPTNVVSWTFLLQMHQSNILLTGVTTLTILESARSMYFYKGSYFSASSRKSHKKAYKYDKNGVIKAGKISI